MFRRQSAKPTIRPRTPCGHDLGPNRDWIVELEGTAKAALETGRTRLIVAGLVFACAFLVVGLRLVGIVLLQDVEEPRLAATPSGSEALETGRAEILDRNGQVLATTLPTSSLYANPRHITNPEEAAVRLATALPSEPKAKLLAKLSADRSFVWMKRGLTPRETAAVNRLGIPGLYFQREERRFYPHGALTSHIVGFTNIDNKGLAGMEQAFNPQLRGSNQPLRLSIDLRIQHILSEELLAGMQAFNGIGAAGLVMDARSGEVLAMVSLPSYDPNNPAAAPDAGRFNRATLGVYEMGSIFKIFTTAMALDSGVVTLEDGYDVTKPIRIARFTITDFHPHRGWLSIPEIFKESSNIGTVHMAVDSGTELQKRYLAGLGLLSAPKLELPEVGQPMIPAKWREINTMTISYGHGIAVTPVQAARAVAGVVNGGILPEATLLKRPEGEPLGGTRVIGERTSDQMRWLMRLVVEQGTGGNAEAEGYLVGGKTGTADKLRPGGGYARDKRIASFAGAFPMKDPRYVVLAMVDEPKGTKASYGYATGGWVAAPVVGKTVQRMAPLLGIEPAPSAPVQNELLVPVNLRGRAVAAQ
jgi:cell division protein FtsI (penicillin-binding protein 3)